MTGSTEFDGGSGSPSTRPGGETSPWAAHWTRPESDTESALVEPVEEELPAEIPAQPVVTVAAPAALRAVPVEAEAWPTREMMAGRTVRGHRPTASRPAKQEQGVRTTSVLGLAGLVLFALLAAFFAWVTAEPLWLAVGHGHDGKASVIQCVGSGVSQRCVGDFTADSGLVVERVALLGVDQSTLPQGEQSQLSARMVGSHSDQAYVGDALRGLHLRWVISFCLAMLCGLGIALSTGAIRFSDPKARRAAVATSLAAPLLLIIGFLAASY
ncbi:MAG: hypothetical protein HOU81_18160 [Hamadaea sp.]|uniref:hypothetical protein n=1 Tax=Hamadaea sp. TaxID=2024425 RepID=UPI00179A76CB|nr:hypothetical protein [Hamadaea sp.]NUR72741.1 hypothetical protein [Hamadaea sp.]NUT18425.1 hypothetical protein [Hamadaea sp.]